MGSACSNANGVNNPEAGNASQSEKKYSQLDAKNNAANMSVSIAASPGADTNGLLPIANAANSANNTPLLKSENTNGSDAALVPQLDINGAPMPPETKNTLIANQASYAMIKETWIKANKKPDFAITVYHKLLMKYQAATEALFYGVDIALQSQRLVDMIGAGIKLLDTPDQLIPVMLQLGSRHVIYGVSDEHFDMINDALAMTLQDSVANWSDELTAQWDRILSLFKTMILHGYTTPAGLQMRKKYNMRVLRSLLKCWRTVLESDSHDDDSFVAVLHRFGRQKVGGRAEMFNGIVARRVPFMAMMTLGFEKGFEDADVIQQARELGGRHIAYGVEERDYDAYAGPFIAAIQQKASPETFNPLVKAQLSLFWDSMTKLMMQGAAESQYGHTLRFAPKVAPFALVMANIEKSTQLWEGQATAMTAAVQTHYRMLRELIQCHDGYEVGVEKDSFAIACKDIHSAVMIAMRLQVLLLRNPIDGFVMDADAEGDGPREVWNNHTLRVRVGVHWCKDATVSFNVPEKRYEYAGPDVEVCRAVADGACGGQCVMSEPTLRHFLNIGRFSDASDYLADLRSVSGCASPKLQAPGGETAKFGEIFQHKPFQQNFLIPIAPSVAALGYPSGMASNHHPAVTNLVGFYPVCLAQREFKGRRRIAPPQ